MLDLLFTTWVSNIVVRTGDGVTLVSSSSIDALLTYTTTHIACITLIVVCGEKSDSSSFNPIHFNFLCVATIFQGSFFIWVVFYKYEHPDTVETQLMCFLLKWISISASYQEKNQLTQNAQLVWAGMCSKSLKFAPVHQDAFLEDSHVQCYHSFFSFFFSVWLYVANVFIMKSLAIDYSIYYFCLHIILNISCI